jgi:hypothetical protein
MAFENSSGRNVNTQYGARVTGGARGVYLTDGFKNEFVIDGVDSGLNLTYPRGDGIRVYYIDKTFAVGNVTSIKIGGIEVSGATEAAPIQLFKENTGEIVVVGLTSGKIIVGYKNVAGDKDNYLPADKFYQPLPAVTSITVNSATGATTVGGTYQIAATALPFGSKQVFTYTSGTPANATVNATGVVTGVAAGTSVITVRAVDDYTKSATVTITVS